MSATSNSGVRFPAVTPCFSLVLLLFASLTLALPRGRATEITPAERARFVAQAKKVFAVALQRFEKEPTNIVAAWEFARAGFDRAEYSTNNAERAALAAQCIAVCREALKRESNCAPAHYYLGMNLGQLAQTKMLGALKIVDEMEREFKAALKLDERLDRAGPDRNLGLLYFEAPVIGSVGSRSKARKHLERAAEVAPDFPENRLNLAAAYAQWHDKKLLQRELDALDKLWPAAKTNFIGAEWEPAWIDWQQRREKLREKAADSSNPLASPRAKN